LLQAERALHLCPHREAEDDEHEDEHGERDGEANSRKLIPAPAFDAEMPLRPMEPIRGTNRVGRIDRWCVADFRLVVAPLCPRL